MEFQKIIDEIDSSISTFSNKLSSTQNEMLNKLLKSIKELELTGNNIKMSGKNIKLLLQIKSKLSNFIVNDDYKDAIDGLVKSYENVEKLQNAYFNSTLDKFKPPQITRQIRNQSAQLVVDQLTGSLSQQVKEQIGKKLLQAVTSQTSYATLANDVAQLMTDSGNSDGYIKKYAKTIATDSLNSFSRQNLQLISSDLGYQWFVYQGSLLETSRDFCEAMKKKKYVHISEFEDVIHGRFEEFRAIEGKINPKTKLPYGFKEDTTAGNFTQVCGGWNCGHQLRPVAEEDVPLAIRNEVYASAAYQKWKNINGIKDSVPKKEQKDDDRKSENIVLKSSITAFNVDKDKLAKTITEKTHYDIEKYENGGVSAVHKRADKGDDLEENINSAKLYARLFGAISTVAEHLKKGSKNPELLINGIKLDNKIPNHSDYSKGTDPYKNIKSPIINAVNSAIGQRAIPVIVLYTRYNLKDVTEGVRQGFLKKNKEGNQVDEIHLRYRMEDITVITRKNFSDGELEEIIKKGYYEPL